MAISADLFRAILAMDSYNRGYDPGIVLTGNQIGNADLVTTVELPAGSEAASFFAQAYTWNGGTIISYRGTDSQPLDWATGWVTGGGAYRSTLWPGTKPQAELAAEFYKAVIGSNVDPFLANVEFTGHSLGGGLAGMMASLYNKKAVVFDNMPFQLASLGAYQASSQDPWAELATGILSAINPLSGCWTL